MPRDRAVALGSSQRAEGPALLSVGGPRPITCSYSLGALAARLTARLGPVSRARESLATQLQSFG